MSKTDFLKRAIEHYVEGSTGPAAHDDCQADVEALRGERDDLQAEVASLHDQLRDLHAHVERISKTMPKSVRDPEEADVTLQALNGLHPDLPGDAGLLGLVRGVLKDEATWMRGADSATYHARLRQAPTTMRSLDTGLTAPLDALYQALLAAGDKRPAALQRIQAWILDLGQQHHPEASARFAAVMEAAREVRA